MLHQPLRGLDGFSARASLQNRRKCRRYNFLGGSTIKYLSLLAIFFSINALAELRCDRHEGGREVCISVIDANLNCGKDHKGYFNECTVTVVYDVDATQSIHDKDESLDISSECISEIEFTSAFASTYDGTKSGFTHESMQYEKSSKTHRFTKDMYFQFTMPNMDIKSVKIKSLGCEIAYVSKI